MTLLCQGTAIPIFRRLPSFSAPLHFDLLTFTLQQRDVSSDAQIVTNLYVNETYVLYQCGTARPAAEMVFGLLVIAMPNCHQYVTNYAGLATFLLAWHMLNPAI